VIITDFSATKTANTSHAMKQSILKILIACSAIALYIHWVTIAEATSSIWKMALKTAVNACVLTAERLMTES
jgi:hypothetical protein